MVPDHGAIDVVRQLYASGGVNFTQLGIRHQFPGDDGIVDRDRTACRRAVSCDATARHGQFSRGRCEGLDQMFA